MWRPAPSATGLVYRQLNRRGQRHGGHARDRRPDDTGRRPRTTATGFHATDAQTPLEDITHYNNFYEFSTDKEGGRRCRRPNLTTKGWQVSVEGLVNKPRVFDLDDLLKISPPEERIYRMRCVEGWSMVIPWAGFSLSKLLDAVEPLERREICRLRDAAGSQAHAGPEERRARLALCRGVADG